MSVGETWQPVDGWPYEVSDFGRVRRVGGRTLAPRRHSNGYVRAQLCRGDERRDFYVHRLVCAAFHGPSPFAGAEVDHRDKDRTNNKPENLRWLSVAQNRAHRTIHRGSSHAFAKLTEAIVRAIRAGGKTDAEWAAETGVSRRQICDVRNGLNWRHVDA